MSDFKLNPEQLSAVEHGEGPLLVIAGPGSGKTRAITSRIVHLLQHVRGLRPENILALTYTAKAAEEMKTRVSKELGSPESLPQVYTFHALCEKVLQENQAGHALLDKIDVWIFLRRRMEELNLEFYQKLAEPGAFLHDLNDFFSRCQDELIEPDDFDTYIRDVEEAFAGRLAELDPAEERVERAEAEKKKELARVFRISRQLIETAGCSSLGSLICETIRLFDRDAELLRRYRERFLYVLIDEFQDTNYGQVELLRRLITHPSNVTAVGDDDQAIYRFRGASHGAFEMFGSAFPGHKTVNLNRNYRSTRKILRSADVVIARNTHDVKKPALETDNQEGSSVFLVESPDYRSESAWIAGEIERLVARGIPYNGVSVLYRAHNHRDLLVEEFRRRKIPFSIRGLCLLTTVILRDLVAYLRLIHSPRENISLTRVLLLPHWRYPESLALAVRQNATRLHCSLFDALESMEKASTENAVRDTGWPELKALLQDLKQAAENTPVTALFDLLVSRLGLSFLDGDDDRLYVEAFQNFLETWEAKSETRALREFIEYFGYYIEAGGKIEAPEPPKLLNAVQMMTAHAAKGMEFPVVFILSVAFRRFPTNERKPVIGFPDELRRAPAPPANIHTQEERRLFYVAMTRARERLYVSSVGLTGKKKSIFIDDLLSNPTVRASDIESIQAPLVAPSAAAPELVESPPVAVSAQAQARLFAGAAQAGWVHPPLTEWSRQTPIHGPVGPDGKIRLSATAIETYLECPLKFKFSHLFKIPTGPQAALTFGNIMHGCIRSYFELLRKKTPQFEDMENIYLDSWKSVGFEDTYQEESYRKAGLAQLRQFVERQKNRGAPDGMELERYFALDCGDIVLEGRIDQINPLGVVQTIGEARGAAIPPVELIDYKTGRPRSQKEADNSLQLSVYALAARRELNLDPVRLTFYYLTNNETISTVRTPKVMDVAMEKIRSVAEEIRSLCFDPKSGFVCKWCNYVPICPAHEDEE